MLIAGLSASRTKPIGEVTGRAAAQAQEIVETGIANIPLIPEGERDFWTIRHLFPVCPDAEQIVEDCLSPEVSRKAPTAANLDFPFLTEASHCQISHRAPPCL